MRTRGTSVTALGFGLALATYAFAPGAARAQEAPSSPLQLVSSRVSLAGTSNIHAYTASTTAARLVRLQVAPGVLGPHVWEAIVKPGALEAFEIAIPAATLSSPKDGLDKNMHKALKVQQHPEIRFHLRSLTHTAGDAYQALGTLTIAGVEKDTTLNLQVVRKGAQLGVTGTTDVLMTDFGVAPPKALMGMVRANPKVVITLEVVLAGPVS